jgi:uncharacterized protein (DUF433 family)
VPHVSVHPEDGQPCFEGTSTPIDVLFANLAAGERLDVILDHFPTITRAAAVAVLRESLRRVREEAMLDAGLSPDLRARAGAVMHPGDWDALQWTRVGSTTALIATVREPAAVVAALAWRSPCHGRATTMQSSSKLVMPVFAERR